MKLVKDLTREELEELVISMLDTLYRTDREMDSEREFDSACNIVDELADRLRTLGLERTIAAGPFAAFPTPAFPATLRQPTHSTFTDDRWRTRR